MCEADLFSPTEWNQRREGPDNIEITTRGIDLAKSVFGVVRVLSEESGLSRRYIACEAFHIITRRYKEINQTRIAA